MERIDPDLFYDRSIVGIEGAAQVGHRGIQAERFFTDEDPDDGRGRFVDRVALRPWRFAAVLFGMGFAAVFVRQAPIHLQIILGAPVFEEMLKFGLALLIGLAFSWLFSGGRMAGWEHWAWGFLRVPIALVVGAGFGVLEHDTTYPSESLDSYIWRVAFHAISTGTSMVAYHAALGSWDIRTRWLAVAPAVALHYVNNYSAIVLGASSLIVPFLADVAGLVSNTVVVLLGWFAFIMAVLPRMTRRWLERWVASLPTEA